MVVAVKIGTNEPNTYLRYNKLSHSEDILQVFREDVKTFGTEGDKQYFAIPVDVSHLSDEEIDALIERLNMAWEDGDEVIAERLYYVNIEFASWITQYEKDILLQGEYIKSNIKPRVYQYIAEYTIDNKVKPSAELVAEFQEAQNMAFDISEVNNFDKFVSLADFAMAVINKSSNMTLKEELGL